MGLPAVCVQVCKRRGHAATHRLALHALLLLCREVVRTPCTTPHGQLGNLLRCGGGVMAGGSVQSLLLRMQERARLHACACVPTTRRRAGARGASASGGTAWTACGTQLLQCASHQHDAAVPSAQPKTPQQPRSSAAPRQSVCSSPPQAATATPAHPCGTPSAPGARTPAPRPRPTLTRPAAAPRPHSRSAGGRCKHGGVGWGSASRVGARGGRLST